MGAERYGWGRNGALCRFTVPVVVLVHECLDDAENVLLLMTREFAQRLKDTPGLADGTSAPLAGLFLAEQILHRHFQNGGELDQVFGLERRVTAFPSGVALLSDAELVSQLRLGEPQLLPGSDQTLTKLGPCSF